MAIVGGDTRGLSELNQPCDSDALKVDGSGGGHSSLLVHDVDAICNQAREIGVVLPSSVPSAPLQGPEDYPITKTVVVIGFDCSPPGVRKRTKSLVKKTFAKCGKISRVYVPYNRRTQRGVGFAYVEFSSADGFKKALKLNEIKLGDRNLGVLPTREAPSVRGPFAGGDNGRDGCFGDSCRGGRGTPVKPRTVTFGTGERTTFDD